MQKARARERKRERIFFLATSRQQNRDQLSVLAERADTSTRVSREITRVYLVSLRDDLSIKIFCPVALNICTATVLQCA